MKLRLILACSFCLITVPLLAKDPVKSERGKPDSAEKGLPDIESKTKRLTRADGFLPLFIDHKEGSVLAFVPNDHESFIYATGLASGLGSNPVGLDRGQWGKTRVVRFKRIGKRVYLIEDNLSFRATSRNKAERKAVRDSFANSVIWATDVVADDEDAVLIDLKTLLIRDAHDVTSTLEQTGQGSYSFKPELSFVDLDQCKAFPENCEMKAVVSFVSGKPGELVSRTAADGNSFSLTMHHSFVKLPDSGYRPRKSDPRVAAFGISFADYSAPLDRSIETRYIARHRLEKADPEANKSPAKQPIIYYLDPGTPQPVRDALLEGARWWNEAFEDAGFIDAYQVKMLPDDADPMDARYNVIQWVHRRTRGWSYGQSITDPRTGEIIKGHVLLGSLRVRQDRRIIEGITSTSMASGLVANACGIRGTGADHAIAFFANESPIDVSLARLRQLSAHEVGHTLGFAHNFAASTYGDRASVMDYPAPRVKIAADNSIDLSDAYGVGVGSWDRFMVRYSYTEFDGAKAEEAGLKNLIDEANQQGLLYLSDADARPAGAANPYSNLWDNGTDPVAELKHLMKVRQIAMQKLGEDDLPDGQSLSNLEAVFVPIYLYHRYQIDGVAKMIGGFDYDYSVVRQKRKPVEPISVEQQQQATAALLSVLKPEQLIVPARILKLLPPRTASSAIDRERFDSRTSMIFDPDAPVRVLAEHVFGSLLQSQRVTRLQAYADGDWNLNGLLNLIEKHILNRPNGKPEKHAQEIVQHVYVRQLIRLASSESTSHSVRAEASARLVRIGQSFDDQDSGSAEHRLQIVEEIRRFRERPHVPAVRPGLQKAPPGSPIGIRQSN